MSLCGREASKLLASKPAVVPALLLIISKLIFFCCWYKYTAPYFSSRNTSRIGSVGLVFVMPFLTRWHSPSAKCPLAEISNNLFKLFGKRWATCLVAK